MGWEPCGYFQGVFEYLWSRYKKPESHLLADENVLSTWVKKLSGLYILYIYCYDKKKNIILGPLVDNCTKLGVILDFDGTLSFLARYDILYYLYIFYTWWVYKSRSYIF